MSCKNSWNHKPKILMVHNYYQIPGGEDTVVANEKKLLEEKGHEVVLYTRYNNEINRMSKIQKIVLPFIAVFNPRTYREIKRIIKEENIEIVHVHNTLSLISPAVYYAAQKMHVPVVQTIHNFRFLCPGATFYREGHICEDCVSDGLRCAVRHKCYRNSYIQTLVCAISIWMHRHTGILGKINYIVLTDFNKEKLLKLKYIKSENVYVKPNFTFAEPIEDRGEKAQRSYYLFIGRIEEIKGVRLLVEAFRKMPNRELRIAGQGVLREQLGESSNIKYLGQIDHNVLMKMIAEAKAVILPSQIYEGFPMTIPEAFMMKTPMIVGDVGNNGSLIHDGINGVKFKYDDMQALIHAIDRFEEQDMHRLGTNAYDEYMKYYSKEANYCIISQIYRAVLSKTKY